MRGIFRNWGLNRLAPVLTSEEPEPAVGARIDLYRGTMQTYLLGSEEVKAYLLDCAERLGKSDAGVPTLWCPIGESGEVLAETLLQLQSPFIDLDKISLITAWYHRDSKTVAFDSVEPASEFDDRDVLLVDSSVHTGGTMARIHKMIASFAARRVCTYSLVIKQRTTFVPSLWGLTINDHDRALFLLSQLPNNRLHPNLLGLSMLLLQDPSTPAVHCGDPNLDARTWQDRLGAMHRDADRRTYLLYQNKNLIGYLTIRLDRQNNRLLIEELAVDQNFQKMGYSGAMMRWAETFARQEQCERLVFRVPKYALNRYVEQGYQSYRPDLVMNVNGQEYVLVVKPLLH